MKIHEAKMKKKTKITLENVCVQRNLNWRLFNIQDAQNDYENVPDIAPLTVFMLCFVNVALLLLVG
jgi:hypothetical protein